jgi:hypothetical protein
VTLSNTTCQKLEFASTTLTEEATFKVVQADLKWQNKNPGLWYWKNKVLFKSPETK